MKPVRTLSFTKFALLLLPAVAFAAPNDPSGGACDGLDPSSGLYPVCIQAYSAKNTADHLATTNASESAKARAQAAVDDAVAEFAALGGGIVPGFEPPTCPCFTEADVRSIIDNPGFLPFMTVCASYDPEGQPGSVDQRVAAVSSGDGGVEHQALVSAGDGTTGICGFERDGETVVWGQISYAERNACSDLMLPIMVEAGLCPAP